MICAGLPHRAAIVAAERLRRAVSLVSVKGIDIPLTISIGVATFPDDGANLAALFAVADARLYEAKDAGRNRVVGWKDPATAGESVVGLPGGTRTVFRCGARPSGQASGVSPCS